MDQFFRRLKRVLRGEEKLTPAELRFFKLAVWSAMLVWLVSFISISFFVALSLKTFALLLFGTGTFGYVMAFVWGVSWIATVFYTVYLIAKFANKKMRRSS